MDPLRFDRLSKALANAGSRRSLVQAAAALAVAGVPTLQQGAAHARRRGNSQGVGAEHWRHKKATYCLNGKTIRRYRRKQEKLLAMGATPGKCGDTPCVPKTCEDLGAVCGSASDGCGGTLECGTCEKGLECCSGQCVNTLEDKRNCGKCGNECDLDNPDEFCDNGTCVWP